MIIKNNFFEEKNNTLERQKEGIKKAVAKLDERFQKGEIDRDKFLKQNEVFANKHEKLNKLIDKLKRD